MGVCVRRMRSTLAALVMSSSGGACTYDIPNVVDGPGSGAAVPSTASSSSLGDAGHAPAPGQGSVDAGMSGDASAGGTDTGADNAMASPDGGVCPGIFCPCNVDTDCTATEHVCAASTMVGPDVTQAAGGSSFCTQGCCTSADCPAGAVCFASGQGGQYCVRAQWLSRTTNAASAPGGSACSNDSDCRSGLCAGSQCADTCCSMASSAEECANGTTCVFGTFPGRDFDTHFAPHCGAGGGQYSAGADCSSNADCESNYCYPFSTPTYCVDPCRTPGDCGSHLACQLDWQTSDGVYAACFPFESGGEQGASCNTDDQCAGDYCVSGQCSGVCFTDADCTVPGWRCSPQLYAVGQNNSYPILLCGP
jgi:hypothetical protein